MKKYVVEVVRTSYCSKTFEIKAENAEMAKKMAMECAYNTDFSADEYDCGYQVLPPQEIINKYIDRYGNPYDCEDPEACWPAGGGLHKDCEFNADALYAYYVVKSREKIKEYLTSKGFELLSEMKDFQEWAKGNTRITFEDYDNGGQLFGYMHTELV